MTFEEKLAKWNKRQSEPHKRKSKAYPGSFGRVRPGLSEEQLERLNGNRRKFYASKRLTTEWRKGTTL